MKAKSVRRKNIVKGIPYIYAPKIPKTKPIMIKRPIFKPFEERVVRVVTIAKRPLTTRQVSKFSGISYNSAKNNLDILNRKGILKKRVLKNRIYWFR